jgi:hypothetical protein
LNCTWCGKDIDDYLNANIAECIGGVYFHKNCAVDYIRNSIHHLKESFEEDQPLQRTDDMPYDSSDELDEAGNTVWTEDDERDYVKDMEQLDKETLG